MKPASFDYHRAESIEETLALLSQYGADAKVIAGGQSLVPLMNFRLARPAHLVDINTVAGLTGIREEDGSLVLGALTRQSTIEHAPVVRKRSPLMAEASALIGHAPIRNRGTVGGSVAHADPSAEYPAAMLALDAEIRARGAAGERIIAAREFFMAPCITTLGPDELLIDIRVPARTPGSGSAFLELTRRHGDFAIVGVAASVTLDASGTCTGARIAIAGAGPTPIRCDGAEAALRSRRLDESAFREAGAASAAVAEPESDIHASAAYRRDMVRVFVERTLRLAHRRAGESRDTDAH